MASGDSDQFTLISDERAVSTNISYVLTATIAALLISVLIGSVSGFVQTQQEDVARQELKVVGHRLAAQIMAADRAAASSSSSGVYVVTDTPTTVIGERYTIQIDTSGEPDRIILTSADSNVEVTVYMQVDDDPPIVADRTIDSGKMIIETNGSGQIIVRKKE